MPSLLYLLVFRFLVTSFFDTLLLMGVPTAVPSPLAACWDLKSDFSLALSLRWNEDAARAEEEPRVEIADVTLPVSEASIPPPMLVSFEPL